MEKITKKTNINYPLYWLSQIEITKLRKDLNEVEKLGATHIDFTVYENSDVIITAFVKKIETDEEFNERIILIEKNNQEIKIKELELLEKLKIKYNNL